MKETLGEMKTGSEPNESADYYLQRKNIDTHLTDLERISNDLENHKNSCEKKEKDFESLREKIKYLRELDNKDLKLMVEELNE